MQYYYLVASLAEQSFDAENPAHADSLIELREQIRAELSQADGRAVSLLYTYYDIQNTIGYINHSTLPFNQLGNLTAEQVAAMVDGGALDDDSPEAELQNLMIRSTIPSELMLIIDRFKERNPRELEDFEPINANELERELYTSFYRTCARSKADYLRQWSDIDRQIRNITAARKARAMKIDPEPMIIEEGELREQLINSQSADFGLRDEFPYMDSLLAVLDTADFVERERRMDTLRWEIADELAEHDYFGVGRILSYLIHMNILHRWAALDKKSGSARFKEIVKNLIIKDKLDEPAT